MGLAASHEGIRDPQGITSACPALPGLPTCPTACLQEGMGCKETVVVFGGEVEVRFWGGFVGS